MNPIQNILVIVDPTSKQRSAVAKGALLAKQLSARLDLFICDTQAARNTRFAQHMKESPQKPLQPLGPWLESIAAPLRDRGLDVTTEILSADPLHTALLERVKHTCAGLVIKDTHHHTIAQRSFLTNTDWELIRGCPVPLLLVKPTPWSAHPRLGAALDPGHADDKPRLLDHCILDEATRLAQALGGELHAIHTYIPAAMIASAVAVPALVIDIPPETLEAERKAKLDDLTAVTSEYRLPAQQVHLEVGGVTEALCRVAQEYEIDIMAMGAISRRGLKRLLIGSTAELVLEQLPCDLLVVKTPNFAELLVL
ncbi:universal stress protein [Peristeroidobacter soli]|jgi:universal stress protein E|uniref:universal stress protein n=1 Tax=Peristeroidobacter soli TaxID=2497877 RepID=UPI00101D08CF|nr:universal stress protein [Peristeroidobacter soli]